MKVEEGMKLREEWAAKGSPPCDHPQLATEHESYIGARTGDKVCTTCGKEFTPKDLRERNR